MKPTQALSAVITALALVGMGNAMAQDQLKTLEYRARMRAAKTVQERQRIREEHRLLIDARAKERGVQVIHPNPAGMPGTPGQGPGRP